LKYTPKAGDKVKTIPGLSFEFPFYFMADCFSGHHPLAYYGSLCVLQRAPEEIFFFILGMPAAICLAI
jgi:hypothetical protein